MSITWLPAVRISSMNVTYAGFTSSVQPRTENSVGSAAGFVSGILTGPVLATDLSAMIALINPAEFGASMQFS
ncbi:unannotated protein [freshwater metagenome]|uniref:Unannotated protein n=1 Tax=freshwater metagenome TaxID=449393 RepID=A0A6J5YD48_9ZZZZ